MPSFNFRSLSDVVLSLAKWVPIYVYDKWLQVYLYVLNVLEKNVSNKSFCQSILYNAIIYDQSHLSHFLKWIIPISTNYQEIQDRNSDNLPSLFQVFAGIFVFPWWIHWPGIVILKKAWTALLARKKKSIINRCSIVVFLIWKRCCRRRYERLLYCEILI